MAGIGRWNGVKYTHRLKARICGACGLRVVLEIPGNGGISELGCVCRHVSDILGDSNVTIRTVNFGASWKDAQQVEGQIQRGVKAAPYWPTKAESLRGGRG